MSKLENLCIYKSGEKYKVVTQFEHQVIYESNNATDVIQTAVDELKENGGDIILGRGNYKLDKEIKLADHIWLHGSGRGTKLRVGADNQSGTGILCKGLDGVEISNLSVIADDSDNTIAGIILDDCGDCKVHDVFSCGFGKYGIWVKNNSFLCEIRGCSLAGNKKANIFMDHLANEGRSGDFIPNLISNCIIYGGGKGIECERTIVLNIVGCEVFQTEDIGYHIHTTSNSVLVSGCRTFQIGADAVVVEETHEFNLSSNIFCWATGHGVVIKDAGWGTICGNEIIDVGSYNSGDENFTTYFKDIPEDVKQYNGIELHKTRGYNITGNTIFNWGVAPKMEYGIFEDTDSSSNVITSNNVNFFSKKDVLSKGEDTVVNNNVGFADTPHAGQGYEKIEEIKNHSTRICQSFEVELTKKFIEEQKK